MKKSELKKNMKVWCWWKSRYLYFTGRMVRGQYEFRDIDDAITLVTEADLEQLKIK